MDRDEVGYSELEEGTELKIEEAARRAYGDLRKEVAEASYEVVIKEELDFLFAAKRINAGTIDIVVVDSMHPNEGCFSEGMLWVRSIHSLKWEPFPLADWTEEFARLGMFLKEFPQFRTLFVDSLRGETGQE